MEALDVTHQLFRHQDFVSQECSQSPLLEADNTSKANDMFIECVSKELDSRNNTIECPTKTSPSLSSQHGQLGLF